MFLASDVAIILGSFAVAALLIVFGWLLFYYQKSQIETTQRTITDVDLIKLFAEQPDGLLSPHRLAEITGMTVPQARMRLTSFHTVGLLSVSYNKKARYFYSLAEPYAEPPEVNLSQEPFLTVDDLLQLYATDTDGQLTMQEIILATRLPLEVVKREMAHFEKEGIVQQLYNMDMHGTTVRTKFFVLEEPYRSNPSSLQSRGTTLDLQLKELLRDENLIV
ncbi:hypothetical protein [Lewinella sp. 4G2]|uniref:hypothetical protein n=1 Tax=Lewinella sp. 4G2 TaxID=1803372 RepID=UPI0007B48FDC|nr:hypothetical protein [Lewinella sp. 4G2]OAV42604.1 hypothetical protein A3850_015265 [Lewinella sp. 4G2]